MNHYPPSSARYRSVCTETNTNLHFESLEPRNLLAADIGGLSYAPTIGDGLIQHLSESVPVDQQMDLLRLQTGMQENESYELIKVETDELGFTHHRYQQYLNDHAVQGGVYTVHSRDGEVVLLSGDYIEVDAAASWATITESEALKSAVEHIGATTYLWQDESAQASFHLHGHEGDHEHHDLDQDHHHHYDGLHIGLPEGELVYVSSFGSEGNPSRYELAWQFDIYATAPLSRANVFVDALSGEVIQSHDLIHHADVPATGVSLYNGTVDITADDFGNQYRLLQVTDGVYTYNMNNGFDYNAATPYSNPTDHFSDPNLHTGVQAHYSAEQSTRYFRDIHGRNGYDDNGTFTLAYAETGVGYVNAYWDGIRLTLGDGDGGTFNPLVNLDIVGHELAHGVTQNSANLIYSYESGALNESFSDIFGEAIEYYATGTKDWFSGTGVLIGGGGIRSLANPNVYGDPDTYLGTNWWYSPNDNGGVHTNSGVQNHWFYLLSDGGTGTNDNGDAFNVPGIGIEDAADIAYRNLTVYLTPLSQHLEARAGSLQAATDLFGFDSPQYLSTLEAWNAVGVYGEELHLVPEMVQSLGTLIYVDSASSDVLFDGDIDSATLELDAGQTIALRATTTGGSLIPHIELQDPAGNVIGTASAVNGMATMQAVSVSQSGTYTINVTGLSSTVGGFDMDLYLNANFEMEMGIGTDNNTMANAENIDSSALVLPGGIGADRLGLVGYLGVSQDFKGGDDFESGSLGAQWIYSNSSLPTGAIDIWGGPGTAEGDYAMIMHVGEFGVYNLNEAILQVDLSGETSPILSFWYAQWVEDAHYLPPTGSYTGSLNADGVSVSDDGITWWPILDDVLDTPYETWKYTKFDLESFAATRGITFGSNFQVKFQQYDDYWIYSDGIGYDDIRVYVEVPSEDWYSFTLDAGETTSLSASRILGADDVLVELYDSGGNLLQAGVDTDPGVNAIASYTNNGNTGMFYARVVGTTDEYGLVVTRGAAFDVENNELNPQNITNVDGVLGSVFKYRSVAADPDSWPHGWILDNRFDGVTLSNNVTGGSIWAADTHEIFYPPTGENVFAPAFGASDGFREFDNELRVDFDELQSFVSIDVGSDDDEDIGWLRAYDSNNVLLEEVISGGVPFDGFQTISIDRVQRDIAYVVAAGYDFHITPLDNLQYTDYVVDIDRYTVSAVSGQELSFAGMLPGYGPHLFYNGLDQPGGSELRIDLLDPQGNPVASGSDIVTHTATQTGNYMLELYSNTGRGEYYLTQNGSAAQTLAFDFGPVGSPVAADFIGVNDDAYDPVAGFGWGTQRGYQSLLRTRGNDLTGDGISAVRADFAVDLANGNYEVDVHIGFALHVDDINVIIEG
ncbi:MAG: M4 family metallopeptidase, partial [Pirellulaceae bacterium]